MRCDLLLARLCYIDVDQKITDSLAKGLRQRDPLCVYERILLAMGQLAMKDGE